ncbi:MAG: DUF2867 domain-containing protein [Burkholderiales bacterium]|nr:DUF2867 domain-containing protein [Burkholderiales bacterium]
MNQDDRSVTAVALPAASRVSGFYTSTDLADAFAIRLPPGASTDPETLARFIFAQQPRWVSRLMGLRDLIVARLGLKTATQLQDPAHAGHHPRVGIFRIYETRSHEIVLGEDDKHLDFRLSVLHEVLPAAGAGQVVLSTVVHCHNRLGRLYILLIAPFHRTIVKASLRRAARSGWPMAAKP